VKSSQGWQLPVGQELGALGVPCGTELGRQCPFHPPTRSRETGEYCGSPRPGHQETVWLGMANGRVWQGCKKQETGPVVVSPGQKLLTLGG